MNSKIGVLVKTSLVDFPETVASVLFLPGCNLRCPYCYNTDLASGQIPSENTVTEEELFSHLEKRKNVIQGFVLSGGEPLLHPNLPSLIKKAKDLGYKVKLDTNGLLPQKLKVLLSSSETAPDFIAMDIKTSLSHYGLLSPNKNIVLPEKLLLETIDILKSLPATSREFRTVLVPPLVTENDIKNIGSLLPENASWQFSHFQNNNCLDPSYNDIAPYTTSQEKALLTIARTFIKNANLR